MDQKTSRVGVGTPNAADFEIAGCDDGIHNTPVQEIPEVKGDGPTKFHVTFFANAAANTLTTDELTLEDLCERVLNASAREKDNLPWLKLARFGKKRTDAGCLRNNQNVEQITGLEIDYDIEVVSFDDAVKAVSEIGIHALIYTSASHTPAKPRWRILAPTSKPLPPEMRAKLVARLNGVLKQKLGVEEIAKSESFTLSQSFYFGWVNDNLNRDHRAEVVEGNFIDLRDDLVKYEATGKPNIVMSPLSSLSSSPSLSPSQQPLNHFQKYGNEILREYGGGNRLTDDEMAALLRKHEGGASDGTWHFDILAVTNEMIIRGSDTGTIRLAIASAFKGGINDPQISGFIDKRWEELRAEQQAGEVENTKPKAPPAPSILTLEQWRQRDLPEPEYLMGSVFSTTNRTILSAKTGLGKSNLAIALGMRMASGSDFLHWQGSGRPARVLYLDGEMSRRLLRQRLASEVNRFGGEPATFLPGQPIAISLQTPNTAATKPVNFRRSI